MFTKKNNSIFGMDIPWNDLDVANKRKREEKEEIFERKKRPKIGEKEKSNAKKRTIRQTLTSNILDVNNITSQSRNYGVISKILNMNTYYLEKINAHLKNGKVPHRHGYKINIPTSKVGMFYNRYTQNIQPAKTGYLKYAQR